jgi:hypothetical protein
VTYAIHETLRMQRENEPDRAEPEKGRPRQNTSRRNMTEPELPAGKDASLDKNIRSALGKTARPKAPAPAIAIAGEPTRIRAKPGSKHR